MKPGLYAPHQNHTLYQLRFAAATPKIYATTETFHSYFWEQYELT